MFLRLYQINLNRDEDRVAFESLENLRRFQGTDQINSGIYDLVFEGELPGPLDPEDLFVALNTNSAIHAIVQQSLSVSDILEYTEEIRVGDQCGRFWFCDSIGFRPVDFDPSKTQKAAPAATGTARK